MKTKGFTLIEIMIVLAIIGILTAIAYPNFTDYLKKAKRSDAKTALMEILHAQAKLRTNCRFYAQTLVDDNEDGTSDTVCEDTAADTVLEINTTSPEGYYTLSIAAGTASANAYTAIADRGIADVPVDADAADGCRYILLVVNANTPNGKIFATSKEDAEVGGVVTPDNTANCL